ncbi:RNA helicase [Pleurotus pulmonarius]
MFTTSTRKVRPACPRSTLSFTRTVDKFDKNWTWSNYVSGRALAEAENVRAQLQRTMERFELELVSIRDEKKMYQSIRQALVCGFFMQVAHREGEKGSYLTVKDNQVVALHPSCGLDTQPEWVLFNEFVLTTRPYIRTVSEVRPEWLLEFALSYFDLSSFPDGETKRALQKVLNKKLRKSAAGAIDSRPIAKKERKSKAHKRDEVKQQSHGGDMHSSTLNSDATSAYDLQNMTTTFSQISI